MAKLRLHWGLAIACLASLGCGLAAAPSLAEAEALAAAQVAALERRLGGASAASGSSAGGSGGHEAHGTDALVYMVLMLIIGTSVLHLTTLPALHSLPYTVVLFILGLLFSLVYQTMDEESQMSLGILRRSYEMWMGIDPHLLIFTMLPVLLTGDAMAMDTSVAKRVASQCVWLAGPGVLVCAMGTALFLHVYMQWDFVLCVAVGAILSATDPVAVVGLLKELGASPTLTVQIQGESLLNDGTAMVLFNICYNMVKGEVYSVKGVFLYLFYMIACSWFLGAVLGGAFSSWIRSASHRLEHHSNLIQISLTVCCAYGSFVFAEGVIGISGVLSTVAAGIVLADTIWPKVISKEAMHEVWHTLEYFGNTVIFFLAGALTGQSMFFVGWVDYLHLLVVYTVAFVIRGVVIFSSRPILRRLHADRAPVGKAEALVMTWGGLRGAVGLALAIQVWKEKADGRIEEADANRILFFTGGMAMLTLIVNATTCPLLVGKLGLTATPHAKCRVMTNIHRRLVEISRKHEEPLRGFVDKVLEDVAHHIPGHDDLPTVQQSHHITGADIVAEYCDSLKLFEEVDIEVAKLLGWDPGNPVVSQDTSMCDLAGTRSAEADMSDALTESFLKLVRREYWAQIERGEFVPGSESAEMLLGSASSALHHARDGLRDFPCLLSKLDTIGSADASSEGGLERKSSSSSLSSTAPMPEWRRRCRKIIKSSAFNGFIVTIIAINSVVIFLDPGIQHPNGITFVIIDGVFLLFYLAEFILKVLALRLGYFTDGWNALDFMCVLLGVFGIIIAPLVATGVASEDAVSNEMLLIRLGRVFKLLRLMRLVVVVKFCRKLHAKYKKKRVCEDLSVRLEYIVTLRAFVRAHCRSHAVFLKFFGQRDEQLVKTPQSNSVVDLFMRQISEEGSTSRIKEVEQARCLLQSLTSVYKAISIGACRIAKVAEDAPWMLKSLFTLRDTCEAAEHLASFVEQAADAGIIGERDAETLIHPLHKHLLRADTLFSDTHAGIHRGRLRAYANEKEHQIEPVDHDTNEYASTRENSTEDVTSGETRLTVLDSTPKVTEVLV